jgi:hypothetical protein
MSKVTTGVSGLPGVMEIKEIIRQIKLERYCVGVL